MATEIEPVYPLRILVEVRPDASMSADELQRIVDEALVEDATGTAWTVRPFGPSPQRGSPPFFEVTGLLPVSPAYSVRAQGFDLAAALTAQLPDGAGVAMPDFPSNAFGAERVEDPDPTALAPQAATLAWPLATMRCDRAWQLALPHGGRAKGEGVVVGHPDTGYTFHDELDASLDLQHDYDVIADDADAEDPMKDRWWWPDQPGHGTSTASVIVSAETQLITGSAPAATLVPIRSIRSVVQVSDGDVALAIDRAVEAGAHVISMSLGGVGFYTGIRAAISRARDAGAIVMAAAGNQVRLVVAPARFPECIAVAATDEQDRPWSGSSRGGAVAISAPGHRVPVAKAEQDRSAASPGSDIGVSSGTSYAVAHLAGVAALWLAFHGRDDLLQTYGPVGLQDAFLEILQTHGFRRPNGWDTTKWGVGIVDAEKVLSAPLPSPALSPQSASSTDIAATAVERLSSLLGLDQAQAREALCEALGCEAEELDELARIHGPELAYTYAEQLADPRDDEALVAEAATASPADDLGARLRATAGLSAGLRRRLGP